jgi:phenylalanyl-tRNA synthetase beta chain
VCKVRAGGPNQGDELLQIVCGAANARAGLKTALAIVGAKLPGDKAILAAKLRGVDSAGMLCSAKELGLADSSEGILELPADAPVGQDLRAYLSLDDEILELNVTPNRGDAMSVLGIAREVAALTKSAVRLPTASFAATLKETFPTKLTSPEACSKFTSRVIRGIDNKRQSPAWLRERLRRAGLRAISPVVDVTNYVMLELGQPMHAYDLGTLKGGLEARFARADDSITLLDGKVIKLTADVVVIADGEGAVGLGGIMGGLRTACTADTVDVLLEANFFPSSAIAGRGRRYGLVTDAGQRFERGMDPLHQERAQERGAQLLLEIAGGAAGPVQVVQDVARLPRRAEVQLRSSRITRLLGTQIADNEVKATLESLGMRVTADTEGWRVTPPSHRFDIAIEPDLIEELARIVGFESIAEADAVVRQKVRPLAEQAPVEQQALEILAGRGYHEAITYAFVDPALQNKLFPGVQTPALSNPIASDMAVMRASLWPGLIKASLENQRRQQDRIRLFEHGARFSAGTETDLIAGIAIGSRRPEQWGAASTPVDFFDVKQDLDALFARTGATEEFGYVDA